MKQKINSHLKSIAQREDIKIIYAVESGSRAWGFPSKDSDWDIRFFYIHKPDWYLSIEDKKDSIEQQINKEFDFSGWELKKTLGLFRKSNPPLLEWLRSPIIYLEEFSTTQQMRELSAEYFNPKSCIYHYFHMAVGNYREYLRGDTVKSKKYFYVLRPILACRWIENTMTMAPMEFDKLAEAEIKDKNIRSVINDLIDRKKGGAELDNEPKIQIINDFLEEQIAYFEKRLVDYISSDKPDLRKLDQLFRNTLKEVWEPTL